MIKQEATEWNEDSPENIDVGGSANPDHKVFHWFLNGLE